MVKQSEKGLLDSGLVEHGLVHKHSRKTEEGLVPRVFKVGAALRQRSWF